MPQISIFYIIKLFLLQKLFKGGKYSRAETIRGNMVSGKYYEFLKMYNVVLGDKDDFACKPKN